MTRSFLRRGFLACLAVCAIGLSACSSTDKNTSQTASMGVINTHCPLMSDHEIDPSVTPAEYKGHKIGFCCSGCTNGWNKMTDEQKDAFVSKSLSKANMGAVGGAAKSDCSGGSCSESAGSCSGESASEASPGAVGGSCCSSSK